MKANRPQVEKALKSPAGHPFFLLHGPDEAGSRALVGLLASAMGAEAERAELTGADLKADPARLSDEAASFSLFGGARYILVSGAGDESLQAVEALLEAPAPGNPVLLLAGALKPTSKLLKLALARPDVPVFASYVPEGRDAERMAVDLARTEGLVVRSDVARRLADACSGNRAILALELRKLALFVDASAERPKPLEHDAIDAVGAAAEEGDLGRLVDAVAQGDPALLDTELTRLESEGVDGIRLLRAVLRRMMVLARLRAQVERGNSVDAVMASQGKSLFWKEKDAVARQLGHWQSELLAKSIGRLVEADLRVKAPGSLGSTAASEELFLICRQAARLRCA